MPRAAIERRPTLDELFGPDPAIARAEEAMAARAECLAVAAQYEAWVAEERENRIELQALWAKVESNPFLAEACAAIAEAEARGDCSADETGPLQEHLDRIHAALEAAHPGGVAELEGVLSQVERRIRRSQELAGEFEEFERKLVPRLTQATATIERLRCPREPSRSFFLPPIRIGSTRTPEFGFKFYPSGDVSIVQADRWLMGDHPVHLFSHFQHWMVHVMCAAEDAASLGMRDARKLLEALGSFVELAARRCREAIDAARASLRRPGLAHSSRPNLARIARELIGELLSPAVLAAGGNLGAFVTRC